MMQDMYMNIIIACMGLLSYIRDARHQRVRLSMNVVLFRFFLHLAPPQTTPDCRLVPVPNKYGQQNIGARYVRNGTRLDIENCESRGYSRLGTPYTCQFVDFQSKWVGNERCERK